MNWAAMSLREFKPPLPLHHPRRAEEQLLLWLSDRQRPSPSWFAI